MTQVRELAFIPRCLNPGRKNSRGGSIDFSAPRDGQASKAKPKYAHGRKGLLRTKNANYDAKNFKGKNHQPLKRLYFRNQEQLLETVNFRRKKGAITFTKKQQRKTETEEPEVKREMGEVRKIFKKTNPKSQQLPEEHKITDSENRISNRGQD